MSPVLGNLIVIIILAVIVFFAARSIWRTHKSGGCSGCGGGSCAGCSGCGSFTPDHRSVPDKKTSVNGGCPYCNGADN